MKIESISWLARNTLAVTAALAFCLVCFAGSEHHQSESKPNASQGSRPKIQGEEKAVPSDQAEANTSEPYWIGKPVQLFDGKTLEGWETISFGGEGECSVDKESLIFESGDPFTGISVTNDELPKTNYELSLDARKTDGVDFFCGLTFPVADSHCTLIVGGWGGATVGLSCIDGKDASQNDATKLMTFKQDQWYKIRVRVEPEHITAWIDDEQVVDQNIVGKKISLRGDTELCKPLGICSFMTATEYKNIQLRRFEPAEKPADATEAPDEK